MRLCFQIDFKYLEIEILIDARSFDCHANQEDCRLRANMIISTIMLDPPAYRRVKCATREPLLHSRFDVTARGSLGMQNGSAAIGSKRGTARVRVYLFAKIYITFAEYLSSAFNKRYVNATFRNHRESGAFNGGTKGTSRRIADLIGGI